MLGASSGVGGAGGTVGQEQNSRLTVDFHESRFVNSANGENAQILHKGFWFQLSGDDQQNAREPWGPGNPQALNRYSYVLSNPQRYSDPTGHWLLTARYMSESSILPRGASFMFSRNELRDFIQALRNGQDSANIFIAAITGALAAKCGNSGLCAGVVAALGGLLGKSLNDLVTQLQAIYDSGGTLEIICDPGLVFLSGGRDACAVGGVGSSKATRVKDGAHVGEQRDCEVLSCEGRLQIVGEKAPPGGGGGHAHSL